MIHTKGPSSGILKLFEAIDVIVYEDIPKSVALVLGVNRLLAMAKDIGGLCPIATKEVFFRLINLFIVL